MKITSAYSSAISPNILWIVLAQSGVKWAVSRAQWVSLMFMQFMVFNERNNIEVQLTSEERKSFLDEFKKAAPDTLMGLPIVIDDKMHPQHIELRRGDEVLHRIESLAIPCGMED